MRASESASRSSAKWASRVMRSSSISRIAARRSRTRVYTSSGPSGVRSTWVSAGIGHGLLHAGDDVGGDTFGGDADGVDDGAGRRRPVRDDADAGDAEEERPAGGVGGVEPGWGGEPG